jgi:hypothetical protein
MKFNADEIRKELHMRIEKGFDKINDVQNDKRRIKIKISK